MPMINFKEPFSLLLAVILYGLVVLLAKETKRSAITAIMLFSFVIILVIHTVMYLTTGEMSKEILSSYTYTIFFDLIFVLISFISYLWIDDIEAKAKKKKSIDNSLDWFWEKI